MTRFTISDLERANDAWRCSCGPAALAAVCDLTLDEVRPMFGSDFPGFTNPTRMFAALRSAGVRHGELRRASATEQLWPGRGICRIQWLGPWMAPNVPVAARYRRTHWIGAQRVQHSVDIWDANLVGSELHSDGWCPLEWWSATLVPLLTAEIKRATGGWHITHSIEVERPATRSAS